MTTETNTHGEAPKKDAKQTRRVVLKREQVLVLPDGVDTAQVVAAAKALGLKARSGQRLDTVAWAVVGVFDGASQTKAIEQHAGKPGTPDAKPGAYKAPPVSSWAGGEVYEAPPAPLVQRRALEDPVAA